MAKKELGLGQRLNSQKVCRLVKWHFIV